MNILIGADCVPTESNSELFVSGDTEKLVGSSLYSLFSSADLRILNLETPITNHCTPIKKCGPALRAVPETMNGIKALGIDVLSIANNHILDQGEMGLHDTLDTIKNFGIDYVGGGRNLQEARKPLTKTVLGKRISIYSCSDLEFSGATEVSAGANIFNATYTLKDINNLKKTSDYIIVLYHGGKEEYQYPTPLLKTRCRSFCDAGANLVICQHSHCIGSYEEYGNSTIIYGQGNFIFDGSDNILWDTSLLIRIADDYKIEFLPIQRTRTGVRLADSNTKEEILSNFYKRSKKNDVEIEDLCNNFANDVLDSYLYKISASDDKLFFRIINKLSGYRFERYRIGKIYKEQNLLKLLNYIECEAHRELIISGLKQRIYKGE